MASSTLHQQDGSSNKQQRTRRGRRRRRATTARPAEAHSEGPPEEVLSVLNLSNINLTNEQVQVLSKGMSYAPTHGTSLFNTRIDLFRFYRSMHLKTWYHHQAGHTHNNPPPTILASDSTDEMQSDNSVASVPVFRPKSRFAPIVSNPSLLAFTKKVDFEIEKLFLDPAGSDFKIKSNVTQSERLALDELSKNDSIIIRPADKGGATVVLSKEQYISEAERQLNSKHYVKLPNNPLPVMQIQFHELLAKAREAQWISDNEFNFLCVEHPMLASFYLLPKIHKEPFDNPPGRPIISGIGTLTEPASKFIDSFIKPYVQQLPSYLEDTTDVLNKISVLTNLQNHFLVTMDVESLYTNIDHNDGLEAMRFYLSDRDVLPPTDFIVELTDWIIHNNVFMFSDNIYKQCIGVPMGSCFSPNYACLYLGFWEKRFVLNPVNPFFNCVTWYGRYIDDLLLVFDGSETQLLEFHEYLNSLNPNIKLTIEYSQMTINFLDLTISKDTLGNLHTTIFRKKTSRNTLLRADSFHPPHLINNIPFGQFQRLRRICDDDVVFETQADDMASRFRDRGYKAEVISRAQNKAKGIHRHNLLIKKKRRNTTQSRPYFVTQYSTAANKISRVIKDNWGIIESDPTLRRVFPEPPVISFKRAPTLRDKLVHNFLPPSKKESWLKRPIGCFKCMNCPHCFNVEQTKSCINLKTNKTYKINDFINCNTTFVIYRLKCTCPGVFYVGRTKRRLRDRLAEHKYAIRTNNMVYPIARHFKDVHNSNDTLLRIIGIEHVKPLTRGGDRLRKLNQRETFWIHSLDALCTPGLNEDIDFMCFL